MFSEPPERPGTRRRLSRWAAAATAVFALLALALALSARAVPAPAPLSAAALPAGPAVLVAPRDARPGAPVRVLVAFESDPGKVRLSLRGTSGQAEPASTRRGGGPPFWIAAEFAAAPAGPWTVVLREGRSETAAGPDRLLSVSAGWSRAAESLYAAWIEALFADADERSSWAALHAVTRDRARNILYDHLGLGEDEASGPSALVMIPDCADNPFFLRAYFAWKTGLPFGFHETSWGTLESPPWAGRFHLESPWMASGPGAPAVSAASMSRLLAGLKNAVHAGNGRTALRADGTDYYPLPLTRAALKPGTVYADPYGHTFVVVRWLPQTPKTPGALLAVDAQPDGTIGVKRFWKGNFLFTTSDVVGEPGFKAFRPIVVEAGRPRLLTNREIAASPDYGDLSLEQEGMTAEAFYGRMERLINPDPLDAVTALEDLVRALHEQLLVRVGSVANGEAYMRDHPGAVIPMPSGKAIFQSLGLWEDYSTPNRDLRLLIAIDTVLEFPDKAARNPEAYEIAGKKSPDEVRSRLQALLERRAGELSITYTRSDGAPQTLNLAEIFRRKDAFEMGYNPNDSVEVRWGAPEGSEEVRSARRRAPASQLEKMRALRPWFHKRLRPS
jgi:hypothetical protein